MGIRFCLLIGLILCLSGRGEKPRLVSSSPQLTELLFQLGLGEQVVGAPQFSDYPPEAAKIPRIGSLLAPSLEATLSRAPDHVLLDETNLDSRFREALTALGLPQMTLRLNSLSALVESSRRLLERFAPAPRRRRVMENLTACVAGLRGTQRFRFLALAWTDPPVLYGSASFLSDLLSRVGGSNAVPASWKVPFPIFSEEWLMARHVDVLFYSGDEEPARALARRLWPRRPPRLVALPVETFARATLTPLRNLHTLGVGALSPGECHAH